MALGTILGLISVVASVGLLALSGWFISATAFAGLTLATAKMFNFFYPSIGVRLFAILRTTARYAERIVSHDATFRILETLRSWFYRHLEPLAPGCLMRYRSADILNRIVADIDALDNLYLRVISPTVVALLTAMMVFIFLWFVDPFLAGTIFIFFLMAGFAVPLAAVRAAEKPGRDLAHKTAELRIRIVEVIQGLPELLVFGAHHHHMDTLRQTDQALVRSQLRMSHVRGFSIALITLLSGLAILLALYLGAELVHQDKMNGINLALVALAVLASFEAILPLPLAYQYLGRTREAGRRLLEIIHTPPAVSFPAQSSSQLKRFDVKFEAVSFRYHDQAPLALREIVFEIAQGKRMALMGETGAGKSTLVNLLVRFWNPTTGRILIGGQDICGLSESDLRRCICVVSQQAHMFNASLRDNLILARPASSEEDLYAALSSAQLLDFVESLPDGLDTWIGESGKLLSGGQARRLAVARAILRDAPIWVLDEPTEGLDTITEQNVMEAIYRLTQGKTLLLITHRPLNLEQMDEIMILEGGRIADRGTHESLMQSNSRYAASRARLC